MMESILIGLVGAAGIAWVVWLVMAIKGYDDDSYTL